MYRRYGIGEFFGKNIFIVISFFIIFIKKLKLKILILVVDINITTTKSNLTKGLFGVRGGDWREKIGRRKKKFGMSFPVI